MPARNPISMPHTEDPFNSDSHENELENKIKIDTKHPHNSNIVHSLTNLVLKDSKHTEGLYDPSMDISQISNISIIEEDNKSIDKEDMVYLTNIYKSIGKLNKKINSLIKNKFIHKSVILNLYKTIKSDNKKLIELNLENVLNKKDIKKINIENLLNFINFMLPQFYTEIVDCITNIEQIVKDVFETASLACENSKNLKQSLEELHNNQTLQIKDFVEKINSTKSFICKVESGDHLTPENVFKNFIKILVDLQNQIKNLEEELITLKTNADISDLQRQLADKKLTIRQLQSQNISFSETITRLDTTNIKLKKECIILSNEYKKIENSLKSKNRIIEKQKNIINVLQKQLYGKDSPLSELVTKMLKIKEKYQNEENINLKQKYKKEIEDYERRIKDFEKFNANM